ncbi:MAG: G-D-S-L family lipolytic protein [Flavobacteriales bacterium]|nr:G-D-S-L family lipolytic protein [Flavobacteriales bacterium]
MKTKNLLYILPLAALTACEPDIDEPSFSAGSADFAKTVAVGNSLTAGYQSGALSADGQINSLPAMIAGQMKQVGGGDFNQPILTGDLASQGAGFSLALAGVGQVETRLALKGTVDCLGTVSVGPVRKGPNYLGLAALAADVSSSTYNNQGVPGAKVTDLDDPAYANPYFSRMRPLGKTMLTLATDLNATFFSLWIGNNDVLGYATTGGDDGVTGPNGLTDAVIFQTKYEAAVTALTANGAKGVVANIPNVTSIPYFTTVPIGTSITQAQADQLNTAYAPYNGGLDQVAMNPALADEAAARKISFTAGVNTFVVSDPSLTDLSGSGLPSIRQIKAGELLVLTTPGDSIKCAMWGTAKPIPGSYHLRADEIQKINAATDAYNATIKSAAQANGLAHVDANARLKELATTGITIDGIAFSSALVTGGAFSLDGVHPATRGYAIIANDFISAINSTYSASIPKLSVGSYPTLEVEQ